MTAILVGDVAYRSAIRYTSVESQARDVGLQVSLALPHGSPRASVDVEDKGEVLRHLGQRIEHQEGSLAVSHAAGRHDAHGVSSSTLHAALVVEHLLVDAVVDVLRVRARTHATHLVLDRLRHADKTLGIEHVLVGVYPMEVLVAVILLHELANMPHEGLARPLCGTNAAEDGSAR